MTVTMLLTGTGDDVEPGREAWIVDEASMLSARKAATLFARAQAAQVRLVLVGDVAQLGSADAGRSFGQLQDAGMATFKLDEIVRQTNEKTREAVVAMLAGWGADVAEAFVEQEQEFRQGDKLQFTRNSKGAGRINGRVASVVAVDPQGSSMVPKLAASMLKYAGAGHPPVPAPSLRPAFLAIRLECPDRLRPR